MHCATTTQIKLLLHCSLYARNTTYWTSSAMQSNGTAITLPLPGSGSI